MYGLAVMITIPRSTNSKNIDKMLQMLISLKCLHILTKKIGFFNMSHEGVC